MPWAGLVVCDHGNSWLYKSASTCFKRYTLTTTQIWRMHWSVAVGATSRENDHSQEYLYAYQWDLGSNVKLPYRLMVFHYKGKCETFVVKTAPVTHFPSP